MRRIIISALLTLGLALVFSSSPSRAQMLQDIAQAVPHGGGAAYTGPGDVTTGWLDWYGMRAFSAASRGANLINVCLPSDTACADFASDATTGNLPFSFTISATACNNSTTICTIKTFYDQGSAAHNLTQATISDRFTLVVSCVSSLPCAGGSSSGSVGNYASASGNSNAQPYSLSAVFAETTNNGDSLDALDTNGGFFAIGFASNGLPRIYAGTQATAGSSQVGNGPIAINGTLNGASSSLNWNGNLTSSLNAGTQGMGNVALGILSYPFSGDTGKWYEAGVNSNGLTTTVLGNVCHNQASYWSISGATC